MTIVIVLVLLVVIIVVAVVVSLYLKTHKRRHESGHDRIHQLQNMVPDLETSEDEREAKSHMDSEYDIIDKPPQNGAKTAANSATAVAALYSNPDEAFADENYSHLRQSQMPPQKMASDSNGDEYSNLNRMCSQTDPAIQMHKPSLVQQNPTDIEMVYAVPDKKKKASKEAPAVPKKASELVEYLDSNETGIVSNDSQTDPIVQKSIPSSVQEKPTDVGMLYAIPDKKKKTSNKAPAVPEKSSKPIEYLHGF